MALPEYPDWEHPHMPVEDYLILDKKSQKIKYEYFDGELRMLAGGSSNHSAIAANLITILGTALKKTPCIVYTSDIRIKLSNSRYVHPDIVVSCDLRDNNKQGNIQHPRIVIEVLSPSTEKVDRGAKLRYYQEFPTIGDYLMVDSRKQKVEHYHKENTKTWLLTTHEKGDILELTNFNIELPLDDIYAKTHL